MAFGLKKKSSASPRVKQSPFWPGGTPGNLTVQATLWPHGKTLQR